MAIQATWYITLDAQCPHCKQEVDLLNFPDFWDGNSHITIGERGTPSSTNVTVTCPMCSEDFKCDFTY